MMGKTHRAGGMVFTLVGFEILRAKGMLLPDINPLLQLLVMYPVSKWGSTLPDLDHKSISMEDRSPFTKLVHRVLHLTAPKHRSWQTHSILFTGGLLFLLHMLVFYGVDYFTSWGLTSTDWTVIRLFTVGLELGVGSHLFLDLINPSGIHLYPSKKISLVSSNPYFATGGKWETLIYRLCNFISTLAFISIILGAFGVSSWDYIRWGYSYIISYFN